MAPGVYAEDPAARQAAHCERDLTRILDPDKCKLADENVSLQKVLVWLKMNPKALRRGN